MFVEITNEPRDYAWGSTTLIPELLGVAPDGRPQAELWLGTHPGSPARLVGRDGDLRDVAGELPFLLKILAAGAPLSLQAHPTTEQAREGFARENAAGIPIDASYRNYKDPHAKPEMIYALSDEFRALCGFRPVAETRRVLDAVHPEIFPGLRKDGDIRPLFEWLLSGHPEVASVVALVTAAARHGVGDSWRTVKSLSDAYPGDPGVAVSLLLNTVTLRRGEALYLPARHIHAYLGGLGIELMGPSDNVLRCGLTPKHIDVLELMRVIDFTPVVDPRLKPVERASEVVFAPDGSGWELAVVSGTTEVRAETPSVVIVLDGVVKARDSPFEAVTFVAADDENLHVEGTAIIARAV
jgi:mannose-6-phosphate isomerase